MQNSDIPNYTIAQLTVYSVPTVLLPKIQQLLINSTRRCSPAFIIHNSTLQIFWHFIIITYLCTQELRRWHIKTQLSYSTYVLLSAFTSSLMTQINLSSITCSNRISTAYWISSFSPDQMTFYCFTSNHFHHRGVPLCLKLWFIFQIEQCLFWKILTEIDKNHS